MAREGQHMAIISETQSGTSVGAAANEFRRGLLVQTRSRWRALALLAGLMGLASLTACTPPSIGIIKTHTGNFTQGQQGAAYTIDVENPGDTSFVPNGSVTVTETVPAGLTLVSMSGPGWTCSGTTCTRSDSVGVQASYPPITVIVNVAANASSPVFNKVSLVSAGVSDHFADQTEINRPGTFLTITKTHTGNFTQGQQGAHYTVTVSNPQNGSPISDAAVQELLPSGLSLAGISGTGWTCQPGLPAPTTTCTRAAGDVLAPGASFPSITVTVNVAPDATSPQVNQASVFSSLAGNSSNTSDSTIILPGAPALSIAKKHTGNFTQGQQGQYTVTVANSLANAPPTSGTVTMTEMPPTGETLVSMSGTGWTCPTGGTTCTRNDALQAGQSYPAITVTVNVANNAPPSVTNQVSVSGGGSASANASDPTTVNPSSPVASISVNPPTASVPAGKTVQFSATAKKQDGTTFDVTNQANWTSSNTATAVVSSTGLATGVAANTQPATIQAAFQGFTGTASLTVTQAVLVSIFVGPPQATVAVGGQQQFMATGTFSDASTQDITPNVNWTSSNTSVATVQSGTVDAAPGLATGVAASVNPVTITATDSKTGLFGTASLTVKGASGSRSTSTTIFFLLGGTNVSAGLTSTQPLVPVQQTVVTVTVTDTDLGMASNPAGLISFTDTSLPVNTDSFSTCTLAQGFNPVGTVTCNATVTLTFPLGVHTINASYTPTDGVHQTSASITPGTMDVYAMVSDDTAGDGAGGDQTSGGPVSLNGDGRYVAFVSLADNLTNPPSNQPPGSDKVNVFVRDTCVGVTTSCTPTTQEVSVDSSGNELGFGAASVEPFNNSANISGDGSIVVFNSFDTDPKVLLPSVFIRVICGVGAGTCPSTTIPQSFGTDGTRIAAQYGVVSRSGRFVAFSVPPAAGSFTNGPILLRDNCLGAPASCVPSTKPVNFDNNGQATTQPGVPIAVSDDGRFVLFDDFSIMPGVVEVYLRDMSVPIPPNPGQTVVYLVSCDNSMPCVPGSPVNGAGQTDNTTVSMSADGRFVSFFQAGLLTPGEGVYVRDTCLGPNAPTPCTPTTTLIFTGDLAGLTAPFAMDASGRFVIVSNTSSAASAVDTCLEPNSPVAGCTPSTVFLLAGGGTGSAISGDGHLTSGGAVFQLQGTNPGQQVTIQTTSF